MASDLIGTDNTGLLPLPNGLHGVRINSADDNTIGTPATPNTIAYNDDHGVSLGFPSTGNTIRGNSIHSNGRLGISITSRSGPRVEAAFTDDEGALLVEGSILSTPDPDTTFIVDFYSNQTGDQGENYLGATTVITNSNGRGVFAHLISAVVAEGEIITTTKTDPEGTTSVFSAGDAAVAAPVVPPDELNIRRL